MIIESIILAIFVCSFGGAVLILAKKLPILNTLPHDETTGIKKHRIILDAENKIKNFLLAIKKQIYFHKFLSWAKCMIMRIEVKIDHLLHGIRSKAQKVDKDLKEKK
jgi:hypothetical protein